MPDTAVNRRKGTTAQHAASFGVLAETSYDTDLKRLVAHDGATLGGFPAAMLHLAQTFVQSQTLAAANNFFGNTTDPDNAIVFINPPSVGTNTLDFNTNSTMDANFLRKYNTTPFQIELAASGNLDLVIDSRNVATGTSVRFLTNGIRDSGTQTLLAEFFDNGTVNLTGTLTVSPAVNTNAFRVANFSLTGSNAQQLATLAGTWDTSGDPIAIHLNILDIASGALSKLLDLQTNSVSRFSVSKTGNVVIGAGNEIVLNADGSASFATGVVTIGSAGLVTFATGGAPLIIDATGGLSWGNAVSQLSPNGSLSIDPSATQLIMADVSTGVISIAINAFIANVGSGELGFFGSVTSQQDVIQLANNVTAGGTADTLDDFNPDTNEAELGTDMVDITTVPNRGEVNANFIIIRNDAYQLGEKVNQIITLLEAYGLSIP